MEKSDGKSEREKELEEIVGRLEEEKRQLEATVLEYQYRTGEKKRPPEEITLKDYLTGLYNLSTRSNFVGENFIVTDATLTSFDFTDSLWKRVCSLGYALYVYLSDTDGKVTRFKHFCPKSSRLAFEEMLNPLVNTYPQVIVQSTSTRIHFIRGLVKKDGEKVYFDNIH